MNRKLLEKVKQLQPTTFKKRQSIFIAEDILVLAFQLVQKQKLLDHKELVSIQKELINSFDNFLYCVDDLITEYHSGVYVDYLTYRSGLQFLDLEKLCKKKHRKRKRTHNKAQTKYFKEIKLTTQQAKDFKEIKLTTQQAKEFKEIVEELDEILTIQSSAPIDPFVSLEYNGDISNIPKDIEVFITMPKFNMFIKA